MAKRLCAAGVAVLQILLRCSLAARFQIQEVDDGEVKVKHAEVEKIGRLANISGSDQHDQEYMTPSEELVWWSDRWKTPFKITEESYRTKDVVNTVKEWCHDRELPPANRAPAKVQGLYFLKGLDAADPVACFSNGMWYPSQRLLRVWVWSSFLWLNTMSGSQGNSMNLRQGAYYDIVFRDESFNHADIKTGGVGLLGEYTLKIFDALADFELIEKVSPGLNWERPSFFLNGVKFHKYYALKVLTAEGEVIEEGRSELESYLDAQLGNRLSIDHWFCQVSNPALSPAFISQNGLGYKDKFRRVGSWIKWAGANRVQLSSQLFLKGKSDVPSRLSFGQNRKGSMRGNKERLTGVPSRSLASDLRPYMK